MPLLIVGIAVVLLLVLMMKFKLNGFIALMIVAILVALWGVATGNLQADGEPLGLGDIPGLLEDGLGGQLGGTAIVIGLGAMLLATINRALPVLGIPDFWQRFVVGLLILGAIVLDRLVALRQKRRLLESRDRADAPPPPGVPAPDAARSNA